MGKNILVLLGSAILVVIGIIFISLGVPVPVEVEEYTRRTKETTEATTTEQLDFKIDDRTTYCAQALELIATVDNMNYYLSCVKSGSIYLVYTDGTEITLKEAMANNKVTVQELESHGLKLITRAAKEE